ncbi:hypothetical protein PMY35_07645 [Clostridium tertium]|uniref:hypothetical protein n=1 Tax=Clostridium tertium TaxID=1559 RepID=UPI00189DF4A0|nr:hypothetical protein [Clostridium tertium]MDB1947692.1 hypothetical protein [Clostridium tertium]
MKEKVIELAKELDKLYYPGIYIFLNKKENTFYVGKAITRIFDRVRTDMLSSHKKTLQEFTQNKDTGLYIFKIDSDDNNKVTFNEKLLLIEYSAYVYMIDKGYNSINDISGFSHKTRELYNINKINICIEDILKFDMNLFWNGFKEVLFDRKYINDLTNENRQLNWELDYLKREYHKLNDELTKYKNKENEAFITLHNKLIELENELILISKNYKSIKKTFIDLGKNIYFLESEFNEILNQINKKR